MIETWEAIGEDRHLFPLHAFIKNYPVRSELEVSRAASAPLVFGVGESESEDAESQPEHDRTAQNHPKPHGLIDILVSNSPAYQKCAYEGES